MDRKELETYLRLESAEAPVGTTVRVMCPACLGGQSGEISLTITRISTGLLYNCLRNSCDLRPGFLPTSGILLPSSLRDVNNDGLRPYHGEYRQLDAADLSYFRKRFDLANVPDYSIGWNDRNEYVMAVRDPGEHIRGYVLRLQPWKPVESRYYVAPRMPHTTPVRGEGKTKLLMHARGAAQAWYNAHNFAPWISPIVLVEDAISAMKVQQEGVTAVALLGTHLDEQKVREIATQRPGEVIIALDADATGTAFKHARRWGLAFKKFRIAILPCDIKDMARENVLEVLGL